MKQLSLLFLLSLSVAAQAQEKPNIVIILADDMGFSDIGAYATYNGNKIKPTQGISMKPLFINGTGRTHDYMYWEHQNSCAVRHGKWKAVKRLKDKTWELYDLEADRTERDNIAAQFPDVVKVMDSKWQQWAETHDVLPKGEMKQVYK